MTIEYMYVNFQHDDMQEYYERNTLLKKTVECLKADKVATFYILIYPV